MPFEIEKRSKVSLKEFNRVKRFLQKNGKFLGKETMKSFLFNKPAYFRIRIVKGQNKSVLTYKSGSYKHKARKEINKKIGLNELGKIVKILKALGFKKCVCKKTERLSFKFNGLKVEVNKIETLGLIVEVEAISHNKKEIFILNKKIKETFKLLKLKELHFSKYQNMMDKLYSKGMKKIELQNFTFH